MKRVGFILILLLLLVGISLRVYTLSDHFTHVDDLMVVSNILDKNRVERMDEAIRANKDSILEDDLNSGLYKTLKGAHGTFYYPLVYQYFKISSRFTYVSKISTYAPLQGGLTSLIVSSDDFSGYESIKWKGRFFSCLFGCLAIVTFVWMAWKKLNLDWWCILFPLVLLVFSWEHIIYSQQMEPYTIAVFFHLLILLWISNQRSLSFSYKQLVLLGLLLGVLSWGQYQLLFCSVALYLALWFEKIFDFDRIKKLLVSGLIFMGIVYPLWFFLSIRSDGGVNWNAGLNGEFLFTWDLLASGNIWGFIWYVFDFFTYNFWLTFKSMLGFTSNENSFVLIVFSILAIGLILNGVYYIKKNFNGFIQIKRIGIYTITLHIVWIALILFGKITFSPTRHSLILVPLWLLLIAFGIKGLRVKEIWIQSSVIAITVLIAICFFIDYPKMISDRMDLVSERNIQEIVKKYKVDQILQYGFTDNARLFSFRNEVVLLTSHVPSKGYTNKRFPSSQRPVENKNCILLFSTKSDLNSALQKSISELLKVDLLEYNLEYKIEKIIPIEVEYSSLTYNGRNGLFIYVFKSK